MKTSPTTPAPTSLADRVRADLVNGVLQPGDRLVEQALCERYGVGRAAVRAALAEFDAEGLVVRQEHRGATVRRVTLREAIEITEARAALEGLAARRAAERVTKEDRSELRSIVKAMTDAVRTRRFGEYSQLNIRLHQKLRTIAAHSVADDLVENLRRRSAQHQYRLSAVPGRAERSLPEHKAIVAAVVAGDPDRAEAAMRAHLESVAETLRHWQEAEQISERTA